MKTYLYRASNLKSTITFLAFNPLTAVSMYTCPDHFSCAKNRKKSTVRSNTPNCRELKVLLVYEV